MGYLISFICALIVFVYTYRTAIEKEKKIIAIRQSLIDMDEKMEQLIIDTVKKLQEDVANLRVEVGRIKTQAAIYSGVIFALLTVITEVIKKI